jgi:hypothetical protein
MANEEIVDKSPDYIRGNGRQYKQLNVDFALPVALLITQWIQVGDFTDRVAEAISVSGATIVKVDAAGAITAISAGDALEGYRIGYQSAAGDAVDAAITGSLEYWSQT